MEHNNYKRVTEQSLTSVVVQGLYLPAGKQEHSVVIAAEVSWSMTQFTHTLFS